MGPINNQSTLVQIKALRLTGDKPFPAPMLTTITGPQWIEYETLYYVSLLLTGTMLNVPDQFVNKSICPITCIMISLTAPGDLRDQFTHILRGCFIQQIWINTFYTFPWDAMILVTWWRHQMETLSALLAICAGNSPITGEFPSQWPVARSFDVLFDMCLNKRLSKQWWGWWFEMPSRPSWRHCNKFWRWLFSPWYLI